MRILMTTVKIKSAIDNIAAGVVKNNTHHEIKILPVHPKRPSNETLHEWQKLAVWADILDFRYWKNALMLLSMFPEARDKPKLLCHYNPYDLNKENWDGFDIVTVCNQTMQAIYPRGTYVPLAINLQRFKFNDNYTTEKVVGMSVSRIEGKKGVEEVAEVCRELGYKFLLIGRVSEPICMKNITIKAGNYLDFREDITDEQLVEAYKEMAVLVVNSEDNYESGPLPLLEAMATGVPVLTREIGHVPEFNNGKNMVVRKGAKGDVEDLKTELHDLMESEIRKKSIREAAWETVKNVEERRIAITYDKLWHKILGKGSPTISIIVPTANRPEVLIECLAAIIEQDYPDKEIVVIDDGVDNRNEKVVKEFRKHTIIPIKYQKTGIEGYGLAAARNIGIINSIGEILVFCDDRLRMAQGALQAFYDRLAPKKWVWGEKDGSKKGFVENFSAVYRKDLVLAGGFNERIKTYGGLTQDIRIRLERGQSFAFELVPGAKATQITKSCSRWKKKADIIESKNLLWSLYEQ